MYYKVNEIDLIPRPIKFGYRTIIVKDIENDIAFFKYEITPEYEKIKELKKNLADTDYQAIKYAEGQILIGDYEPIKEQRQAWRDEINRLEAELK